MPNSRPNVIVFMTDDQGYGDLSCMGAEDFKTPTLDRMAKNGARFTDWYSNSPVCSPSRAALLSGRYPGNAGVRAILRGHRTATGLPASTPTLATMLKSEGYKTGLVGKWHLGLAEQSRPGAHGFDQTFGFMAGCIDFFSHIYYWGANRPGPSLNPTHDLWENNEEIWRNGEYFTELIAEKAVEFIRDTADSEEPFFLYVPFNAPHYPMHAPQKYMDRFPDLPWDRQVMAAMISAVDDAIAAIQDELERQGLTENTLSFFMSDNGPSRESRNWLDGRQDPYYGGTSGGLKGHKFSLFDGGVKVPGIVHWPVKIPGGQVIGTPAAAMDIVPTVLDAVGAGSAGYEIDGTSLLSLVTNDVQLDERPIFWEMEGQTAVRRGKWKLVLKGQLVEEGDSVADVHLSDVESDPSESVNLAEKEPKIANELKQLAEEWRAGIEARWERDYASSDYEYVAHGMV
jgi:arylsulfatase A-like enzyme